MSEGTLLSESKVFFNTQSNYNKLSQLGQWYRSSRAHKDLFTWKYYFEYFTKGFFCKIKKSALKIISPLFFFRIKMIKSITFDLWDTLFKDDSDEAKRAALGLPDKAQARLQLLLDEITLYYPDIRPEQVSQAFQHANRQFQHFWKEEYCTPSVAERLQTAYNFLNLPLSPGFEILVHRIEEMEVQIPPDPAPGVHQMLKTLSTRYTLGIISDTVHTPGRGLRKLLEQENLLQYFKHCIFSDEAGASKPSPRVFEQAARKLKTPLLQIVHVGDRESNDIAGPLAMGMQAILYTGLIDRGSQNTQATAICRNFADLPEILQQLETKKPETEN